MSSLNTHTLAGLRRLLDDPGGRNEGQVLEMALRIATVWRSRALAGALGHHDGLIIQHGPFAGMQYVGAATEGALLPRLIGSYECELHPHIEALAAEGIDTIVDVGCAEGYYAVGLARMIPHARVHAYDTDEAAREACQALAELNGVQDRVKIGETFAGRHFADFAPGRTLIFMDIEGGERVLLDPVAWPALKALHILVETHPRPGHDLTALMIERFKDSHDIVRVDIGPKTTPLPEWMQGLSHIDQLIAVWEWRRIPTPWLVMRPKSAGSGPT
jgi:precorrin-6B methylase 2